MASDGEFYPPAYPWRVRAFLYGCAARAEEEEHKRLKIAAGAK